jgi:DNA-directed RNA polymerase subunit RPC12/RpoP
MVNDRELLGSSEITALLSGLRQPGPLGRLEGIKGYRCKGGHAMNRYKCPACGGEQYTACDTAERCIYCGHKELKKMEILEQEVEEE